MSWKCIILRLVFPLVILSILATATLSNQYWNSLKREREAYFISIHYLAASTLLEDGEDKPKDFDDLMGPYDGIHASIATLFPDGLVFTPQGSSFTLEEPYAQRVSLFRTDRLIATDKKWPKWESSGEHANKFPDEGPFVLPPGYE